MKVWNEFIQFTFYRIFLGETSLSNTIAIKGFELFQTLMLAYSIIDVRIFCGGLKKLQVFWIARFYLSFYIFKNSSRGYS